MKSQAIFPAKLFYLLNWVPGPASIDVHGERVVDDDGAGRDAAEVEEPRPERQRRQRRRRRRREGA